MPRGRLSRLTRNHKGTVLWDTGKWIFRRVSRETALKNEHERAVVGTSVLFGNISLSRVCFIGRGRNGIQAKPPGSRTITRKSRRKGRKSQPFGNYSFFMTCDSVPDAAHGIFSCSDVLFVSRRRMPSHEDHQRQTAEQHVSRLQNRDTYGTRRSSAFPSVNHTIYRNRNTCGTLRTPVFPSVNHTIYRNRNTYGARRSPRQVAEQPYKYIY